MTVERSVICLR